MRFILKNLIAVFGVIFLGMGMANASTLDCGDDDAEPIIVHSAAMIVDNKSKTL